MKPRTLTIADLFCGAGGTSTGAVEAALSLGYLPKLTAVNHWAVAVETHTANHPDARHFCASLDSLNPRHLFKPGELDVLIASPECMSHSNARGGKPVNDQSRATAWCVLRWADALLPDSILIENVPEFQHWAPVGSNGRPLKSRRGEVFQQWCEALRSLGYTVGYRVFCAADYGDPTTRRRLFVQAVRGRRKVVWPTPTHTGQAGPSLFTTGKPWAPARSVIDWTLKGKSIYGRKKPLAEKTLRRIFDGLERFGLKPFLLPKLGVYQNNVAQSVDNPSPTVICDGRIHLAEPYLVQLRGTNDQQIRGSAKSIDAPAPTLTGSGAHLSIVEPFLVEIDHQSGKGGVASPAEPLSTVTTKARHCVAQPYLVQVNHGNGVDLNADSRRVKSVDAPLPTVCGARGEWAVCEPFIVGAGGPTGSSKPVPVDSPMGSVLCDDRRALVEPIMLPQQSGGKLRPVSEPVPTVATDGAIGLLEPVLVSFYGTMNSSSVGSPVPTVTTKDRFGLVRPVVVLNGQHYELDILFRMLQPHELAGAQGFRPGYQFRGTKTEVVKQIGNAVPRRLARALVAAMVSQNPDVSACIDAPEVAA